MDLPNENTDLPSEVAALCQRLEDASTDLDLSGRWPTKQLQWCAEAGVYRWFIAPEFGGWGWDEKQILSGYLALSQSCLATTFVLTQWNAACRRIAGSKNAELRARVLPQMASGEVFATVGISHLTTSRQHVSPVLTAEPAADGAYVLNGFSPWVTGGYYADLLVLGATQADRRQLLAAIPRDRTGVEPLPGADLVALTASGTDRIDLSQVRVEAAEIVSGPVENVMSSPTGGGGAGGLQTSTLAVGLSLRAARFLQEQAAARAELLPIADKISADVAALRSALYVLTSGDETCGINAAELRRQANSLVLRSTQAALQAAKGAGFLAGHPTGRWARETMFFLVWSCPQPVSHANMCELAQIEV